MTASVKGQPWLEATATRAVMAALEAAGGADCARFVGGCVRNSLMGRAVDDIDIATRLTPEQTMAALKAVSSSGRRLRSCPMRRSSRTISSSRRMMSVSLSRSL